MKAALFYAHAASNWGDLAINKGIVNLFEQLECTVENIHGVRLPHNAIHTLNSDISLKPLRILPVEFPSGGSEPGTLKYAYEYLTDIQGFIRDFEIDSVDVVLLNSGEHLYENADGTNISDLAWRMLPLIAGAHAQVPVVQLPATVGPLHTQRVTGLFRSFLRNLHEGAVRDDLSKDLVDTFGSSFTRVLDPGFFGVEHLPARSPTGPNRSIALIPRLEDFGLRAGTRRSAYVLAKHRGGRYEDSRAFQLYSRLAHEILSSSSSTLHLVIQTWADRELIESLYAALSESDHASRVWLHDPADYDTFAGGLADMDVVVTSRFHAAILALTQGVPAVGIYSDAHGHKMPGLFSMLGFPENAIRLQDRVIDTVVDEVIQAVEVSEKKKTDIYGSVTSWKESTEAWFRDMLTKPNKLQEDYVQANIREIDQIRIELITGLHQQIVEYIKQDNYKSITTRLSNIEKHMRST